MLALRHFGRTFTWMKRFLDWKNRSIRSIRLDSSSDFLLITGAHRRDCPHYLRLRPGKNWKDILKGNNSGPTKNQRSLSSLALKEFQWNKISDHNTCDCDTWKGGCSIVGNIWFYLSNSFISWILICLFDFIVCIEILTTQSLMLLCFGYIFWINSGRHYAI